MMRAKTDVVGDGFTDDGQDGHEPLLVALAGHDELLQRFGVAASGLSIEGKCFANAQAGAIEKQQKGRITLADPIIIGNGRCALDEIFGLIGRERPWQALFELWCSKRLDGRVVAAMKSIQEPVKAAQGGEVPGNGAARMPISMAGSEPGAKVYDLERRQLIQRWRAPQMLGNKTEKGEQVSHIGLDG